MSHSAECGTHPGLGVDERVRYAGLRLEGGQELLRRVLCLVAEHDVSGQREARQQSSHEPDVCLKHRHVDALKPQHSLYTGRTCRQ